MAFRNTLIHRLLTLSKSHNRITSRANPSALIPPDRATKSMAKDPGEHFSTTTSTLLSRTTMIQRRSSSTSTSASPKLVLPYGGDSLIEKLRGMNITKDRIRLDGLIPPPTPHLPEPEVAAEEGLTAAASDEKQNVGSSGTEVELLKAKLSEIPRDWISYPEFVVICTQHCAGDKERGMYMARLFEDSGAVVVIGNGVCLHPEQVVKAIQGLIPLPLSPNDPRRKELNNMEKSKSEIDQKADALVRREMWGGLVYLVAQTAAFMRLTFWELSWDVMEPICFFVTSFYFMAGYAFFLRTSTEPSFEGFFHSRFQSKQRRLMQAQGFDLDRYNELRRACGLPVAGGFSAPSPGAFDNRDSSSLNTGAGFGSPL